MIVDGTATLESLVHEYVEEHKPELGYLKTKKLQLSAYVDRQLKHLVIEENFDFEAISDLLRRMFPENYNKLSRVHCQERWTQIHLNRKYRIDEARNIRQDKKLLSVMAFEDPKKLFSAKQLVEELEIEQKKRSQKRVTFVLEDSKPQHKGFDITKDSIRKRNEEEAKKLENDLMMALEKAKEIDEDMCEKPYLYCHEQIRYRPKFIMDNFFELEKEDLTKQKATEILSQKVMVNNYVVGQFTKTAAPEIPNYKSRFAHMTDNEPKGQQASPPKGSMIEDNWSDYESDSSTEQ